MGHVSPKKLSIAALCSMASALVLANPAISYAQGAARDKAQVLSLTKGPLGDRIIDLSEALGVNIFAPSGLVAGKQAPALSGTYSADAAIDTLLAGSGLEATPGPNGGYVLAAAPQDNSARLIDDRDDSRAIPGSASVTETIVVTGSRIERTAVNSPAPIDIVTAEDIASFGFSETTEALRFVPALNSSISLTSQEGPSGGSARGRYGLASLNLRNLGANRTLVLVNGRRHVGGEANSATVDVSSI
ncbi:MAG: secretin and TonB N-terminal domain-containing protein, partial [Sphingomonadales bacterium]